MTSLGKTRISVAIVVLTHLIVNLLHGQAHTSLGVGLSSWQQVYVIVVILLAPLIAFGLSLTKYLRAGLWLLLVSMFGSLIFGACYHYVIITSDHVAHLPTGDARGLFRPDSAAARNHGSAWSRGGGNHAAKILTLRQQNR